MLRLTLVLSGTFVIFFSYLVDSWKYWNLTPIISAVHVDDYLTRYVFVLTMVLIVFLSDTWTQPLSGFYVAFVWFFGRLYC